MIEASIMKDASINIVISNLRHAISAMCFCNLDPAHRTHHSWAAHLEELIQFIQKFISLLIRGSITVELKQNTEDVHLKFSLGIFSTYKYYLWCEWINNVKLGAVVGQQPSLYGDCRVVLFIVKEEVLRHPLQTLAAGLDREVILGIVAETLQIVGRRIKYEVRNCK